MRWQTLPLWVWWLSIFVLSLPSPSPSVSLSLFLLFSLSVFFLSLSLYLCLSLSLYLSSFLTSLYSESSLNTFLGRCQWWRLGHQKPGLAGSRIVWRRWCGVIQGNKESWALPDNCYLGKLLPATGVTWALPCSSFPWSFKKSQGKPSKTSRILLILRSLIQEGEVPEIDVIWGNFEKTKKRPWAIYTYIHIHIRWIQEGFTAEPPRNDSGGSEMIRVSAQKSELQTKSRSYRPKVRVTAGKTPRIRTESSRNGSRMGFRCFYRKLPLKPSWIQLTYIHTYMLGRPAASKFIYVRPEGGPENTSNNGENPNINNPLTLTAPPHAFFIVSNY